MHRYASNILAGAILFPILCSIPSLGGGEELTVRPTVGNPILRDVCADPSLMHGKICTYIRRAGFSCDETLYLGRPTPFDDMVIGLEEYVVACASKDVHTMLQEEAGTECVFVRFFRVAHISGEFDINDEINLWNNEENAWEADYQWRNAEIRLTVDNALLDRELEPCDKKELFPSYLGKRNVELIKKLRQDSLERACRKRVLNCGAHWP